MTFNFERINSITESYKIRRLLLYLCITLLTFAGGAITAGFWFVSRQNTQPETKIAAVNPVETKTPESEVQKPERTVQDCYQVGVDERRLGVRHYVQLAPNTLTLLGDLLSLQNSLENRSRILFIFPKLNPTMTITRRRTMSMFTLTGKNTE